MFGTLCQNKLPPKPEPDDSDSDESFIPRIVNADDQQLETRNNIDEDDYEDEDNPISSNPTHSSAPFTDRVKDLLIELWGNTAREFGGRGDCGPASLSGVLNFHGITVEDEAGERFHGSGSKLRQLIVTRARNNVELLDRLIDIWTNVFPGGFEVQEANGLRIIDNVDDYLTHMATDGSDFDDPAWEIAAVALDVSITIQRVG